MRIQKSHLHDTVSPMRKHPQHTSKILRTDETRITRQIWRTPKSDDAVPQHFNPKGHKLADVELISFEIIISKSESVRRACEYRNSAGNCILKGKNHAATWHKQIHYETGICENPMKII